MSGRMRHRPRGRRAGLWVLALAAGSGLVACTEEVPDEPSSTGTPVAVPSPSPVDAVAAAQRSVVSVEITVEGGQSSGSGVVLTADGHVLAPVPAVDRDIDSVTVTFGDGDSGEATAVGSDSRSQLAVVKVKGVADLVPAVFSDGGAEIGDEVRLVGGPLVLGDQVSSGSILAVGAPFGAISVIHADTTPALGSSGGPLVDTAGEVVGIAIGATDPEGGTTLAVPSGLVSRIADQLIAGEPVMYPFLGVSVEDADGGGAAVQDVPAGSPAAPAGLQPGDVITQVGDHPVDTAGDVVYAVQSHAVGDEVTVTYTRDGSGQDVTVILGPAPAQ